ncbi:MAG: hypothetical protein H7318_15515 [Oligoflexus sp.]|nr:hypothetical protein [Oligoflexus sp.]
MLRRTLAVVWLSPLSLWLGGCASYTDDVREMTNAFKAGDYNSALTTFEKSEIKTQDRNRLLYYLEKGTIEDRLSERKESRTLWMKADKLADDLYTTSISKAAASFLYNDSATPYGGEDYEKVAIHTMLAHSFLSDNQLQDARVEAAKINSKLNEINGFYKDNKNKYRDDAYARYLSGLIWESSGEPDSAIVDYRAALKVYESDYSSTFNVSAPRDLVRGLYRLYLVRNRKDEARILADSYKELNLTKVDPNAASVVVVHEVGVINEKRAEGFVIPIGSEITRFSFPVIRKQGVAFRQTGVRLNDGLFEPGELAQNFNAIAYESLEDRRLRMIAKSMARLILKSQMTQRAEKELGALGLIAGSIYGAVTETADTRGWVTLPAAIYVTRVFVKPGEYSIEISNNGRTSDIKKVHLKPGQLVLMRDAAAGKLREAPERPNSGQQRFQSSSP